MSEPVHIKEILPSVLIKAARKQAERDGIPWPELSDKAEAEFRKSDLDEIMENIGKEMLEDKNDSRQQTPD